MLTSNNVIQRRLRFWPLPALLCAVALGIIGMHVLDLHQSATGSSHGVHGAVMDVSGADTVGLASATIETTRAAPAPAPAPADLGVMALCMAMLAGAAFTMLSLLPRRRSLLWSIRSASSQRVGSTPITLFRHRLIQQWPVWRFSVIRC